MKKLLPLAALVLVAACQKAETQATIVEAVPANEAAASEPAIEMPVQETAN